jgi:hypothetical protein
VKIAHFQVKAESGRRTMTLTRLLEGLRGVAGVVAVRSMGLITVLYDEQRTDPLVISGEIARQAVDSEADEPGPEPARRRPRPSRGVALGPVSMQR